MIPNHARPRRAAKLGKLKHVRYVSWKLIVSNFSSEMLIGLSALRADSVFMCMFYTFMAEYLVKVRVAQKQRDGRLFFLT